jgi:protein-S-isoprenylcysteine O-methyltransferase Ste14
MSLIRNFDKTGNFLFRYRGQFPVLLFLGSIPFIWRIAPAFENNFLPPFWTFSAILCCLLGFAVRGYAIGTTPRGTSGRNTAQQVAETVNKTGIYSIVRHPLYLGNYLIWLGLAIFTFDPFFIIIFSLTFWIYYERIMFAEERFLENKFGNEFLQWAGGVPPFIPKFSLWTKPSVPFSIITVLRREYSGIIASVFGFVFTDIVRHFALSGQFAYTPQILYPSIVITLFCLLLRTLKHHTKLLNEEGRN